MTRRDEAQRRACALPGKGWGSGGEGLGRRVELSMAQLGVAWRGVAPKVAWCGQGGAGLGNAARRGATRRDEARRGATTGVCRTGKG